MSKFQNRLSNLKRPKIIIKAAKIASQTYRRSRDLSRVLGYSHPALNSSIHQQLFDLEHSINQKRCLGDASYDLKTHVQVLSALLAEVSVDMQSADHTKLSGTEAFFCTT